MAQHAARTGHQVDRLGGMAGEHDLPGASDTDEGVQLAPGRFDDDEVDGESPL